MIAPSAASGQKGSLVLTFRAAGVVMLLAIAACSSDDSQPVPSDGSSSTVFEQTPATDVSDGSVEETNTPATPPPESTPASSPPGTDPAPVGSDPPPFVINGPATVDDDDDEQANDGLTPVVTADE